MCRYIMRFFTTGASHKQSMQLAVWVAILSVIYQQSNELFRESSFLETEGLIVMIVGAVGYTFFVKYRYTALYIFVVGLMLSFVPGWHSAANHTWLAVWTLTPIILFRQWWKEVLFANYIRYTLGLVMVVAVFQKLIAGTYLDGSYIAWLSANGSTTERTFSFLCAGSDSEVCAAYVFLGVAALVWQFAAGILLLLGVKHFLFILAEVSFLLTVGLFADEMNFQVLNIALFCIAFQFGMTRWIALVCVVLLHIDLIGVSEIVSFLYHGLSF
jgi:hypothetical protein